ncbi:MAG: NAD-dependent epimerase/dehydratase family protein [Verrucomicrobiota bacterium]
MNSPKHLLVIGHGFIGSAVAKLAHESGSQVTAVNRTATDSEAYPVVEADVTSDTSIKHLAAALKGNPPDWILHCASSSRGGADTYREVFVAGIKRLAASFQDTPVAFTSSTSVYGQTDGPVVTESSPTEPDRETGRLLLEAEASARATGGLALRLAGIYGPGRSIYLKRLFEGTATIESGEVSRAVNQIHQIDAAKATLHLMATEHGETGATFNIVDNTSMTQRELYTDLARKLGFTTPPDAPPDMNRKRAWTNKIVSNLALRSTGWEPIYPGYFDAIEQDPALLESYRK